MAVVKFLFVLMLAIPVAIVLIYFIFNMIDEFKSVLSDSGLDQDKEADYALPKIRKKRRNKIRTKNNSKKNASETDRRQYTSTKEPHRIKARTYYTTPDNSSSPSYPKDPYSNYRRPDFDAYIKNANAREKEFRDSSSNFSSYQTSEASRTSMTRRKRKHKHKKSKGRVKR